MIFSSLMNEFYRLAVKRNGLHSSDSGIVACVLRDCFMLIKKAGLQSENIECAIIS